MVKKGKEADSSMPFLLYLQGGPGYPSPRLGSPPEGWLKVALETYRVLLLDQRGTGRSTPATVQHLGTLLTPEAQADYLAHFRADAIVADCELVREKIAGALQSICIPHP